MGIDETVDQALGDSTLGAVENMEYTRLGRLVRRKGAARLGKGRTDGGGDAPNGRKIYPWTAGARYRTQDTLLDWNSNAGASRYSGGYHPQIARRTELGRDEARVGAAATTTGVRWTDAAVMADGRRGIACWTRQSGADALEMVLFDPVTKALLSDDRTTIAGASGTRQRCIATETFLAVIYSDGSELNIIRFPVGASGLASTTGTIDTIPDTSSHDPDVWDADAWDATDGSNGDDFIVMFRNTGDDRLYYLRVDGTALTRTYLVSYTATATPVSNLAIRSDHGANFVFAYTNGGVNLYARRSSTAGAALTEISIPHSGYNTLEIGIELAHASFPSSIVVIARLDLVAGQPSYSMGYNEIDLTPAGEAATEQYEFAWLDPKSLPWRVGTRCHFVVQPENTTDGYFDASFRTSLGDDSQYNANGPSISAIFGLGTTNDSTDDFSARLASVTKSTGAEVIPADYYHVGVDDQFRSSDEPWDDGSYAATAYSFRYEGPDVGLGVQLDNDLYLASGVVHVCSSDRLHENSLVRPAITGVLEGTLGGFMTSVDGGQYQYRVVFEWTGPDGNRHRSPPSDAVTATVTGPTANVALSCTPAFISEKPGDTARDPAIAILYRTVEAGGADGVYHRVGSYSARPNSGVILITDGLVDSDIEGNDRIYTVGGVLESDVVPAGGAITMHKQRLWVRGNYQDHRLYYSKVVLDGRPPEFNLATFIDLVDGGEITGLASYSDVLIVFKRDSIYAITGNGPSDTGLPVNGWNEQLIDDSIGCVSASSVVVTPAGVFFQSSRGFYVLAQGMNVQPVGEPVRRELGVEVAAGAVCYGAVATIELSRIRWLFVSGATSSREFVYHYEYGTWTTNTHTLSALRSLARAEPGLAGPLLYITEAGHLLVEYSNDDLDDSNSALIHYTCSVRTNWLTLAPFDAGYKRLWFMHLLGQWVSAHDVAIQCESEYGRTQYSAYSRATTHDFLDSEGFGSGTQPYDLRVHLRNQHGDRFRFTIVITDAVTSVEEEGGECAVLHSLALDFGTKTGMNKRAGGSGRSR